VRPNLHARMCAIVRVRTHTHTHTHTHLQAFCRAASFSVLSCSFFTLSLAFYLRLCRAFNSRKKKSLFHTYIIFIHGSYKRPIPSIVFALLIKLSLFKLFMLVSIRMHFLLFSTKLFHTLSDIIILTLLYSRRGNTFTFYSMFQYHAIQLFSYLFTDTESNIDFFKLSILVSSCVN
jgi:hypothetical protein